MSKLMARLDRIAKGTPRSLGFTPSANQESIPTLALVARLGGTGKKDIGAIAKTQVDAVMLPGSALGVDNLERNLKPLDGRVWGVMMDQPDRDGLQSYRDKGCDFLAFGIEGTTVDVLEEGECARALRVPVDLEEPQLRGLEDLPVDLILMRMEASEGPLSLSQLLAISNVRSATGRYLLLEWDAELTTAELEHLRDIGVDGLVVNAQKVASTVIFTLRERIDSLPRRKPKGDQRSVAVLPRMGEVGNATPHRHEEEEEEEWDEP